MYIICVEFKLNSNLNRVIKRYEGTIPPNLNEGTDVIINPPPLDYRAVEKLHFDNNHQYNDEQYAARLSNNMC